MLARLLFLGVFSQLNERRDNRSEIYLKPVYRNVFPLCIGSLTWKAALGTHRNLLRVLSAHVRHRPEESFPTILLVSTIAQCQLQFCANSNCPLWGRSETMFFTAANLRTKSTQLASPLPTAISIGSQTLVCTHFVVASAECTTSIHLRTYIHKLAALLPLGRHRISNMQPCIITQLRCGTSINAFTTAADYSVRKCPHVADHSVLFLHRCT